MFEYTPLYIFCNRRSAMSSQSDRTPVRLRRFDELEFVPRFEYGDMAESVELCGLTDGTRLGTGFARMKNAHIPWTIQYDEVLILLEGELHVHTRAKIHKLSVHDSLWLPAGTELVYEADSALVAYAIYPSNWHEG
jgi:ethanolamine utilization protein EutQ